MGTPDDPAEGPLWSRFFTMQEGFPPHECVTAALNARYEWWRGRTVARQAVADLVPLDLHPRCELLVETAYVEGFASWCGLCLDTRPLLRSPVDLRRWCVFLFEPLRTADDHPAHWEFLHDDDPEGLYNAHDLALPLFSQRAALKPGGELDGWVEALCLGTFRRATARSCLSQKDLVDLVRSLWDHMRRMGAGWPDEPGWVYSTDACRDALTRVIGWCDGQRDWEPPPGFEYSMTESQFPSLRGSPAGPAGEEVEWTQPDGIKQWARVFGLSDKTMKKWLDNQVIRNQQLSPRRYRIATHELPGDG